MQRLSRAEQLLQSLGISEPTDIDLEAIALCSGAEVREQKLQKCEAQIIGYNNNAIVIVNEDATTERKRFSIGHELGHWEHHKGQSFICRSEDIREDKSSSALDPEKIADNYAVDLLLPEYMFEKRSRPYDHTCFEAVLELKDTFQTSITATALRFTDFAPQPCVLACYDKHGLKWFKKCRDIPQKLFLRSDLDEDTFAYDILSGKQDNSRPRKIPAEAWFNNRGLSDYEVYEDTIRINNNRILTFLSWRDEDMLERYAA